MQTKDKITNTIPIQEALNNKQNKKPLIKLMRIKGTTCVSCNAIALEVVKYVHTTKNNKTHKTSGVFGINTNGETVQFTIDHIIPKSKCPKGIANNLQVMCYVCNQKKSNLFEGEVKINKMIQYQNKIRKFADYLCGLIDKIIRNKTKCLLLKRKDNHVSNKGTILGI